ncbi:MAG: hypothetical protein H6718_17610 [Polyangiaceae bacterium]|nr:hypothetical protein [Myxococcales bacterium]MCB9587220.1 hypothetical protein [Polyangiaceae bacterium]MCB9609397.1 hypothetical protein [Polyangiaceae bacterium]
MKSHRARKGLVAAATLFVVAGFSLSASAEVKTIQTDEKDVAYTFKDDLLNSDIGGPNTTIIKLRPQAAKSLLIRPRVQFITELLKSAENL